MTIWIPDRNSLTAPLHASLAAAIATAIDEGRLRPGDRLPTHRRLSEALGISVHTVSKAYDSLRRQNLIDGHVGRGSFVLDPDRPEAQPFRLESEQRGMYDLSISRPAYSALHAARMQETLGRLSGTLDPSVYLSCRPNVGRGEHREAGAEWLELCGLRTRADSVLMTNGVTHGMSAALSALTRPGDAVLADEITHHLLISSCAFLGLRLIGVATDREGILPDALEKACRDHGAKVLFSLPTLTSPTASMMPETRRRALVDVARRHDIQVIENDAFGPLMEDRPPPLAALAPERTVYLTTFTKCTVPGLRAGYIVGPGPLLPALTGRLIVFGWMATSLVCELATRWVRDGTARELLGWQRGALAERHAIVAEELAGFDWQGHPSGLHVWLRLPEPWITDSFVAHARQLNVAVAPETPFLTSQARPRNAVRISLGGVRDPSTLRQALRLLSGLLRRPFEPLPQAAYR